MEKQLIVLYVGSTARGLELSELGQARGWYVSVADTMMSALADYVVIYPDAIIIDSTCDFAAEAFAHLRSVGAQAFVILGENIISDDAPTLTANAPASLVLNTAQSVARTNLSPA
jgi:hypothetical protein